MNICNVEKSGKNEGSVGQPIARGWTLFGETPTNRAEQNTYMYIKKI